MRGPDDAGYRETIWGINPEDRQWFQLLTLIGGIAGSIILTQLEIAHQSGNATPNEVARNILLGIGASFVASGFISWGLLQAKELLMAIADWIRRSTARREERWREEGRREGRREGYERGYEDAQKGKPKELLGDEPGRSS